MQEWAGGISGTDFRCLRNYLNAIALITVFMYALLNQHALRCKFVLLFFPFYYLLWNISSLTDRTNKGSSSVHTDFGQCPQLTVCLSARLKKWYRALFAGALATSAGIGSGSRLLCFPTTRHDVKNKGPAASSSVNEFFRYSWGITKDTPVNYRHCGRPRFKCFCSPTLQREK